MVSLDNIQKSVRDSKSGMFIEHPEYVSECMLNIFSKEEAIAVAGELHKLFKAYDELIPAMIAPNGDMLNFYSGYAPYVEQILLSGETIKEINPVPLRSSVSAYPVLCIYSSLYTLLLSSIAWDTARETKRSDIPSFFSDEFLADPRIITLREEMSSFVSLPVELGSSRTEFSSCTRDCMRCPCCQSFSLSLDQYMTMYAYGCPMITGSMQLYYHPFLEHMFASVRPANLAVISGAGNELDVVKDLLSLKYYRSMLAVPIETLRRMEHSTLSRWTPSFIAGSVQLGLETLADDLHRTNGSMAPPFDWYETVLIRPLGV